MGDLMNWLIVGGTLWLLWRWLRKPRRRAKRKAARVVAAADLGEAGKPLTLAKAKTELRRALQARNPGIHRESLSCEAEDFENAVTERQDQLEFEADALSRRIEDAEDALYEVECDLEEARDELIADPRRADREVVKARMKELAARQKQRRAALDKLNQRLTRCEAELAALRKDKRAILVDYINARNRGVPWYEFAERRKGG